MKLSTSDLSSLRAPVQEHLLPLLQDALKACVERHEIADGRGADGFSFGTDAWSLPARLFRDAAEEELIPFEISNHQGLELAYDGFRIRHHRVGDSEAEDIWQSFPSDAKAVAEEIGRQFELELEGINPLLSTEPVVLAFMANPVGGLCALYLCTVGIVKKGRITSWSEAIEVWRRDEGEATASQQAQGPAPETSPTPIILRRQKAKREND